MLLIYFLFKRLNSAPVDFQFSSAVNYHYLLLLIFLMPINWYIEWIKWNVILQNDTIDFERKKHAFLSGIVSAIITPAYAGNFIGRMLYFPKSDRKQIVVNTLASNASQFIISISLGIFALQFIYFNALELSTHALLCAGNLSLYLLYYYGDFMLKYIPIKYIRHISQVIVDKKTRGQLMVLSFMRYMVFVCQFAFALLIFDVPFSFSLLFWIMLMYCAITLSPSLFMGKLIVRETVAVTVLSIIGIPVPIILMAALSTWLINQILPAILATLFVKKERQHVFV